MADFRFEHHYANLKGLRLHYVSAGRGTPMVLLHGWPQTWYEWRRLMPLLADSFAMVAPDLRGLGDSSRPSTGYDKKTVANDVWELMRNHLAQQRFIVVGHDWGAPVAFRLAADHPEPVTHLVMLDVPVPGDRAPGDGGLINPRGATRWHHLFHQVPDLPEALTVGRERTYLEFFFMNGADQADTFSDADIAEYVRTYSQPGRCARGSITIERCRATSRTIARRLRTDLNFRCRRSGWAAAVCADVASSWSSHCEESQTTPRVGRSPTAGTSYLRKNLRNSHNDYSSS